MAERSASKKPHHRPSLYRLRSGRVHAVSDHTPVRRSDSGAMVSFRGEHSDNEFSRSRSSYSQPFTDYPKPPIGKAVRFSDNHDSSARIQHEKPRSSSSHGLSHKRLPPPRRGQTTSNVPHALEAANAYMSSVNANARHATNGNHNHATSTSPMQRRMSYHGVERSVSPNHRRDHQNLHRGPFGGRDGPRAHESPRYGAQPSQLPRHNSGLKGLTAAGAAGAAAGGTLQQQQAGSGPEPSPQQPQPQTQPQTVLSPKKLTSFRTSLKILQDYAKFYEHMHKGPKPTPQIHFKPNLQIQLPEGMQQGQMMQMQPAGGGGGGGGAYEYQGQHPPGYGEYWQQRRQQGVDGDVSSSRSPYTLSPSTERESWMGNEGMTTSPQASSEQRGAWVMSEQSWQQHQQQRPNFDRLQMGDSYNSTSTSTSSPPSVAAARTLPPNVQPPSHLQRRLTYDERIISSSTALTPSSAPVSNPFATFTPPSIQDPPPVSPLDKAATTLSTHLLYSGRRSATLAIQAARDYVREYPRRPGISKLEDCIWELWRILDRGVFAGRLGDEVSVDWKENASEENEGIRVYGEEEEDSRRNGCCYGTTTTYLPSQQAPNTKTANPTTNKRIAILLDRSCCCNPPYAGQHLGENVKTKPNNPNNGQSFDIVVGVGATSPRRRRRPRRAFSSLPALSGDAMKNTHATSGHNSSVVGLNGAKQGDDLIVILLHHMLHAWFLLCLCSPTPSDASSGGISGDFASSSRNDRTKDARLHHTPSFYKLLNTIAQVAAGTDAHVQQYNAHEEGGTGAARRLSAVSTVTSSTASTFSSAGSNISSPSNSDGTVRSNTAFADAVARVYRNESVGAGNHEVDDAENGSKTRQQQQQQQQGQIQTQSPSLTPSAPPKQKTTHPTTTRRHSSYSTPTMRSLDQQVTSPTGGVQASSPQCSDPGSGCLFPISDLGEISDKVYNFDSDTWEVHGPLARSNGGERLRVIWAGRTFLYPRLDGLGNKLPSLKRRFGGKRAVITLPHSSISTGSADRGNGNIEPDNGISPHVFAILDSFLKSASSATAGPDYRPRISTPATTTTLSPSPPILSPAPATARPGLPGDTAMPPPPNPTTLPIEPPYRDTLITDILAYRLALTLQFPELKERAYTRLYTSRKTTYSPLNALEAVYDSQAVFKDFESEEIGRGDVGLSRQTSIPNSHPTTTSGGAGIPRSFSSSYASSSFNSGGGGGGGSSGSGSYSNTNSGHTRSNWNFRLSPGVGLGWTSDDDNDNDGIRVTALPTSQPSPITGAQTTAQSASAEARGPDPFLREWVRCFLLANDRNSNGNGAATSNFEKIYSHCGPAALTRLISKTGSKHFRSDYEHVLHTLHSSRGGGNSVSTRTQRQNQQGEKTIPAPTPPPPQITRRGGASSDTEAHPSQPSESSSRSQKTSNKASTPTETSTRNDGDGPENHNNHNNNNHRSENPNMMTKNQRIHSLASSLAHDLKDLRTTSASALPLHALPTGTGTSASASASTYHRGGGDGDGDGNKNSKKEEASSSSSSSRETHNHANMNSNSNSNNNNTTSASALPSPALSNSSTLVSRPAPAPAANPRQGIEHGAPSDRPHTFRFDAKIRDRSPKPGDTAATTPTEQTACIRAQHARHSGGSRQEGREHEEDDNDSKGGGGGGGGGGAGGGGEGPDGGPGREAAEGKHKQQDKDTGATASGINNSSSDEDADDHLYMRRLARREAMKLARELGSN